MMHHQQTGSSGRMKRPAQYIATGDCQFLIEVLLRQVYALSTRVMKDKKKPPGVSEATMAYFKVAFQAISEAVDGDLATMRM